MQKFVYERSLAISGANTNCFAKKFLLRKQPRPQGFSLKKWVGPFFEGKALGTRLLRKVILGLEFYWKKMKLKGEAKQQEI